MTKAAHIVARDQLMRGNTENVLALIRSTRHSGVILGAFAAYQRLGLDVDSAVAAEAWAHVAGVRVSLVSADFDGRAAEDIAMRGAAWLSAMVARHQVVSSEEVAARLGRCYPSGAPFGLGDRHGTGRTGILFVIALRAALEKESLSLDHFRPPRPQVNADQFDRSKSNDDELREYLQPALGWLAQWADFALDRLAPDAFKSFSKYRDTRGTSDGFLLARRLARQIVPVIARAATDGSVVAALDDFARAESASTPEAAAIDLIAPLVGDPRFEPTVVEIAAAARASIERGGDLAESRADSLVQIARGLYAYSGDESAACFQAAVDIASRAGDDSLQRWDAVVALAGVAQGTERAAASGLAQRLVRVGESLMPLLYDGFDEQALVRALGRLVGSDALRFVSQWRDRRFGDLAWQLTGLSDEGHGLLVRDPMLALVLAPLSSRLGISTALHRLAEAGPIIPDVFASVQDLASRLGRPLDVALDDDGGLLPHGGLASEDRGRSPGAAFVGEADDEREAAIQRCRDLIAGLDLSTSEGILSAAEAMQEAPVFDMEPVLYEMRARSPLQWGRIVSVVMECNGFSPFRKAEFLNAVMTWPRRSQAFDLARAEAVRRYVEHNSAAVLQQNWSGFDLRAAAPLVGATERDLRLLALEHLVLEEALQDAAHCYRLASGVAEVLNPSEAASVLAAALEELEEDLDLEPMAVTEDVEPEPTAEVAVANFLWAALGDPRNEVRWLAAHATRTVFELAGAELIGALCEVAGGKVASGFGDSRFPFYSMSAAEWFMLAVERAYRGAAEVDERVARAVILVSERYPDHAAVQMHCFRFGSARPGRLGNTIGTAWGQVLAQPIDSLRWKRPGAPAPFTTGAPQSEFQFPFDLDEYLLAGLTESFEIDHKFVLDSLSTAILDEWGWRSRPELDSDPRREAGAYREGETYHYKSDLPLAEDLDYYLARHAALTVAGRLMRTARPYRDTDTEEIDVLAWLSQFGLARADGLWISDLRRPVPSGMRQLLPVESREQWRDDISDVLLQSAVRPADSWVTLVQDAEANSYDLRADSDVFCALADPATSGALARALQTGNGYMSFRLPTQGDEDVEFNEPPFTLEGWLVRPSVERGIDLHDPLAADLERVLPRPADFVIDTFSLKSHDGGSTWVRRDELAPVLVASTWSTMTGRPEPQGMRGSRLCIRQDFLDELLSTLGRSLVVESRLRRWNRRNLTYSGDRTKEGRVDDGEQFRVCTYEPHDGWRDP